MFAEYMTLFLTLLLLLAQVRCDCAHGLRLAHDRLGCLQSVLFCVVNKSIDQDTIDNFMLGLQVPSRLPACPRTLFALTGRDGGLS
eukprot:3689844-Rhodomonas_salina.6